MHHVCTLQWALLAGRGVALLRVRTRQHHTRQNACFSSPMHEREEPHQTLLASCVQMHLVSMKARHSITAMFTAAIPTVPSPKPNSPQPNTVTMHHAPYTYSSPPSTSGPTAGVCAITMHTHAHTHT